jgi:hypothetical protein
MQRHWTAYIGFLDHAKRLAKSDSCIMRNERNVLASQDGERTRYRVGLMPDENETVVATFVEGRES